MDTSLTKATDVQQEISEALDETLLEGVKRMKHILSSGEDVRGASALLNVARQRLRDLGITKIVAPGDAVHQFSVELGKIPDMEPLTDPDDDEQPLEALPSSPINEEIHETLWPPPPVVTNASPNNDATAAQAV